MSSIIDNILYFLDPFNIMGLYDEENKTNNSSDSTPNNTPSISIWDEDDW